MDIEENFESQLWGFKIFRGSIGVCCLNLSFEIFFFFFKLMITFMSWGLLGI